MPLSMQLVGLKVPLPAGLTVKLTVPVGLVAPVIDVSLTAAVQVVGVLTVTGFGVQETVVVVGRVETASVAWPWLVAWVVSPL